MTLTFCSSSPKASIRTPKTAEEKHPTKTEKEEITGSEPAHIVIAIPPIIINHPKKRKNFSTPNPSIHCN